MKELVTPQMIEPAFASKSWYGEGPRYGYVVEDLDEPNEAAQHVQVAETIGLYNRFEKTSLDREDFRGFSEYLINHDRPSLLKFQDGAYSGYLGNDPLRPPESDRLENQLLLYFNPGAADAPRLMGGLILASLDATETVPYVKFHFDGFDYTKKNHRDRVVLYADTLDQARVAIEFAQAFEFTVPELSGEVNKLAQRFTKDEESLGWVALADSPDTSTGMGIPYEHNSFTTSRVEMIMQASRRFRDREARLDRFDKTPNCTFQELAAATQEVGLENGIHPESFAFNAPTDIERLQSELIIEFA